MGAIRLHFMAMIAMVIAACPLEAAADEPLPRLKVIYVEVEPGTPREKLLAERAWKVACNSAPGRTCGEPQGYFMVMTIAPGNSFISIFGPGFGRPDGKLLAFAELEGDQHDQVTLKAYQ